MAKVRRSSNAGTGAAVKKQLQKTIKGLKAEFHKKLEAAVAKVSGKTAKPAKKTKKRTTKKTTTRKTASKKPAMKGATSKARKSKRGRPAMK